MPVSFPPSTRVTDIQADLEARGYTDQEIQSVLSAAKVEDGLLAQPLELALRPPMSGAPSGVTAPVAGRQEHAVAAERASRRSFVDKFLDKQTEKLLETRLREDFELTDGVAVEVRNEVLESSADPVQQRFLSRPNARLLASSIRLDGDFSHALGSDNAAISAGAGLELRVELPFDDFSGGNWKEHLRRAGKRLDPLYALARLPSDAFWQKVVALDVPAGTRVVRTVEVDGGLGLSGEGLTASGGRRTRLEVAVTWDEGGHIVVSVDRLRDDSGALGLQLDPAHLQRGSSDSNHEVHTYRLDLAGDGREEQLEALQKALSWSNGLVPPRVDTARLDRLGRGEHLIDVLTGTDKGVTAYLPIGSELILSGGTTRSDTQRVWVSVPDHRPSGPVVYREEARQWAEALASGDETRLTERPIEGLMLQRVAVGRTKADLQASLGQVISLMPGVVGMGVAESFATSTSSEDVIGTKIEYDSQDANRARVTVWKIDTDAAVRRYAVEAGLVLNEELRATMSQALAEHLLGGSLERYADKLAEPAYEQLSRLAGKLKLSAAYSKGSSEYGYESLTFDGFDLRRKADREAFAALVGRGDVQLAVSNDHLVEAVQRARDERSTGFEATALGVQLLAMQHREWKADETQRFRVGGEWVEVRAIESGATHGVTGLTEEHQVSANSFAVLKDGKLVDFVSLFGHRIDDAALREGERDRLERAAAASGCEVVTREVGEGGGPLGWLLGDSYGKASVGVDVVLTADGNRAIFQAEPAAAARRALVTAGRVRGIGLPPSEVVVPGCPSPLGGGGAGAAIGLTSGLTTSEQRAVFSTLAEVWSADVKPGAMERAREQVRGRFKRLAQEGTITKASLQALVAVDDATLDDLIYRAVTATMLREHRRLRMETAHGSAQPKGQPKLEADYYVLTKRFEGEGRNLEADLWVIEQAEAMREMLERPEVVSARATLASGAELQPEQVDRLLAQTFRDAAMRYGPSLIGDGGEEAALTFWLTLLGLAGCEGGTPRGVALFDAHAKKYAFVAHTPGVARREIDNLLKARAADAVQRARRQPIP